MHEIHQTSHHSILEGCHALDAKYFEEILGTTSVNLKDHVGYDVCAKFQFFRD